MYSVPMAIADFIPVFLFFATELILQRDLYNKMSKGAYALFCAGTIDVFMAGFLKALYKLLYAANICDFKALSNMFFPVQALGFLMAGNALLVVILVPQGKNKLYSLAAPAAFSGTFIFVALMVLGLGGMCGSLAVIAKRMKKPAVIVLFVLAFVFSLMMGYLSAKDFTQAYMNWAAEGVNTFGQLALFLGVWILHKAGLNDFQWRRD